MSRVFVLALALATLFAPASRLTAQSSPAAQDRPEWAYAVTPPPPSPQAAPDNERVWTLPGTDRTFTRPQIRDLFGPADWYPDDHPLMPPVVATGRRPEVRACAMCHYPNGKGRPENAGVAGLPITYFVQQMIDFRNGVRKSAHPGKTNTTLMADIAKGMTDEEISAAAEYFGSMRWTPWIRVVETATVPKMRLVGGVSLPLEGAEAGTEPLGARIVETPENVERSENQRDPRSGWVAYVPVGSIQRGEALVTTGNNGRTVACAVCHGTNLQGLGPVPGIAGRSPSYLVRQMYDMKVRTRRGPWAELMDAVVDKLANDDLLNIAAYVSSRPEQ